MDNGLLFDYHWSINSFKSLNMVIYYKIINERNMQYYKLNMVGSFKWLVFQNWILF